MQKRDRVIMWAGGDLRVTEDQRRRLGLLADRLGVSTANVANRLAERAEPAVTAAIDAALGAIEAELLGVPATDLPKAG